MKNSIISDLNFFKSERSNVSRANKQIQITDKSENNIIFNLNTNNKKEDILIPSEVETYLNVKKKYILYKYNKYSL